MGVLDRCPYRYQACSMIMIGTADFHARKAGWHTAPAPDPPRMAYCSSSELLPYALAVPVSHNARRPLQLKSLGFAVPLLGR